MERGKTTIQSPIGPPTADVDRLASRLHDRYAAALCISDLGPHSWDECDCKDAWRSDAIDIVRRQR